MRLPRQWTREEDSILLQKYGDVPIRLLGIDRDPSVIVKRAKKLGIVWNTTNLRRISRKKLSCNEKYFSILTPQSAYWAGFIAADGCVVKRDRALVLVSKLSDKHHLEKFAKNIEFTGFVHENQSGSYKPAIYARLAIYDVPGMLDDLKNIYNIVPRKTTILIPPNLMNFEHQLAYLAGFIDGDGSIYMSSQSGQVLISIGGREVMMLWFKSVVDRIVGFDTGSKVRSVKGHDWFCEYKISTKNTHTIASLVRGLDIPLLERKWNHVKN